MIANPLRSEIDHRTIKLLVGLVAISLANLTSFLSASSIESISASYHVGGSARDIFVGFLFAVSAFMLAYNGKSTSEMVLSKIAAVAGMGVAFFPCECGDHDPVVPRVHGISAAVMFIILAGFCYIFYKRACEKGHTEAKRRAYIYAACGVVIALVVVTLAADRIFGGFISAKVTRLVFYGEKAGLIAFGVSWLTASRVLPVLTERKERFSPFTEAVPD